MEQILLGKFTAGSYSPGLVILNRFSIYDPIPIDSL